MKFSELIQHVGDEHVELQNIAGSLIAANLNKKGAEITFATDKQKVSQLATMEKPDHVGLVVWLPRSRLPENMR